MTLRLAPCSVAIALNSAAEYRPDLDAGLVALVDPAEYMEQM
jgi:hypothetical protein